MKRILIVAGGVVAAFVLTSAALAEAVRVTLDKYEFVRLDRDLATVLIANPIIADVGIESTRLIVLVGRVPGETELVVLDSRGNEILKSPVVVVPNLERTVTVQRGVREATLSCAPRCTLIPNPGAGKAAPGGGGAGAGGEEEEEAKGPPAPSAEDVAAAAAAAAAAAVAEQKKEGE